MIGLILYAIFGTILDIGVIGLAIAVVTKPTRFTERIKQTILTATTANVVLAIAFQTQTTGWAGMISLIHLLFNVAISMIAIFNNAKS